MLQLTAAEARQVAVRAQLLDSSRPTDLQEMVEHLTYLPVDLTAAIAPAADLVAWTRLGAASSPDDLVEALAERVRPPGIARARGTEIPGEPIHVGDTVEPAVVEGVAGEWRVDPAYLDGGFAGRTALLSPFDALVRDRTRMDDLFGFDYVLEMYKPAAKRRWGYFALPVLHHDRLVGKLDATADRKAGRFFVDAVHEDGRWTARMRRDVDAEVSALADWLGLVRA